MLLNTRSALPKTVNCVCRKYSGFTGNPEDDEDVTLDNVIKKVTKFSYRGDVLPSGGVVQEAVTARIKSE